MQDTFVVIISKSFEFLERMGFVKSHVEDDFVRYVRHNIEVDISRDPQSYEVSLQVGPSGNKYSLSEVIRRIDKIRGDRYRDCAARTSDELLVAANNLADILRRYGQDELLGAPSVYEELSRRRQEWSERFALEVRARQVRGKAAEAFRSGEYLLASELYGEIRPLLTAPELKKLEVAIQRSRTIAR